MRRFILFCLFLLAGYPLLASFDYQLEVDLRRNGHTGAVRGRVVAKSGFSQKELCLYLPFNDPYYYKDAARGMSPTVVKYGRHQKKRGQIRVLGQKEKDFLTPYLLRLRGFTPGQILEFESSLPKWGEQVDTRWFYNDYYPVPLLSCPAPEDEGMNFQRDLGSRISFKAKLRSGWKALHAGENPLSNSTMLTGGKFSFTYFKDQSLKIKQIKVNKTTITLGSFSSSFAEIIANVRPLFLETEKMLGPYPFKTLLVLETEDLEKSLVPGIITINREKQRDKKSAKKNALHWHIWQLANFLPQQWLGVSLFPPNMAEFWFHKGMADVTAYLLLKNQRDNYDLFSKHKDAVFNFNFDYRQAQDLVAGVLTFLHPFNALTNSKGETLDELEEQHSFGYVRNSLAFRYLYWNLGKEKFSSLLKEFVLRRRFLATKATDFLSFVKKSPKWQKYLLDQKLLQWWQSDAWPDFFIEDVIEKKIPGSQKTSVKVVVAQSENFDLKVDVVVKDDKGGVHRQRVKKHGSKYIADYRLDNKIDSIAINPNREVFDWDRFDNTNFPPKFHFFPGTARTLKDDATTVIWLPLFAKLPGEDFSLIFSSVVLRYLQNIYTTMVSYVPNENRFGFQGFFLTDLPKYGLFTVIRAAQDFGNSLRGERILELGLYRAPFIFKEPLTEVGLRLRSKQQLGVKSTLHQTLTARLKVIPLNPGSCYYKLMADLESAPKLASSEFSYQRNALLLQANCRVFTLDLGARVFAGDLQGQGLVPNNVLFKPQHEDEARLRIDSPNLGSVEGIQSLGLDVLWPAKLPLPPELFLLPRESRWRLFYDFAKTRRPNTTIKDAGVGLLVPVGGDAVGKRSISLLQFSFLAVLYREYEGERDRTPGILIDFLGKL